MCYLPLVDVCLSGWAGAVVREGTAALGRENGDGLASRLPGSSLSRAVETSEMVRD
jgi:hypothetical protein